MEGLALGKVGRRAVELVDDELDALQRGDIGRDDDLVAVVVGVDAGVLRDAPLDDVGDARRGSVLERKDLLIHGAQISPARDAGVCAQNGDRRGLGDLGLIDELDVVLLLNHRDARLLKGEEDKIERLSAGDRLVVDDGDADLQHGLARQDDFAGALDDEGNELLDSRLGERQDGVGAVGADAPTLCVGGSLSGRSRLRGRGIARGGRGDGLLVPSCRAGRRRGGVGRLVGRGRLGRGGLIARRRSLSGLRRRRGGRRGCGCGSGRGLLRGEGDGEAGDGEQQRGLANGGRHGGSLLETWSARADGSRARAVSAWVSV
ncbi:MAG: hypothetical protein QM783_15650 [Phycisphaerales bacterium]